MVSWYQQWEMRAGSVHELIAAKGRGTEALGKAYFEAFCLLLLGQLLSPAERDDVHFKRARNPGRRLADVPIAHHAQRFAPAQHTASLRIFLPCCDLLWSVLGAGYSSFAPALSSTLAGGITHPHLFGHP